MDQTWIIECFRETVWQQSAWQQSSMTGGSTLEWCLDLLKKMDLSYQRIRIARMRNVDTGKIHYSPIMSIRYAMILDEGAKYVSSC